jgi:hypothetical protein
VATRDVMWQTDDADIVRSVIERRRALTDVVSWFDPDLPLQPCQVQFVFGISSVVVAARGEDDTVLILRHPHRAGLTRDRGYLDQFFSRIRGMRMAWARLMTNHLGYTDGIQLDFESGAGATVGVVAVAAASSLQIRSVLL